MRKIKLLATVNAMDTYVLLLSLIPLVGLNVWHNMLLTMPSADHKPRTISEHAASSEKLLLRHRAAHTVSSIILTIFASFYLLPHGYTLAGYLLIGAAIFDVLEALTLNKKSASQAFSYHVITAWAMALCYLLYASMIVIITGFSLLFVFAIWVSFAVFLTAAVLREFKDFWITQHIYFCSLALVIAAAHVTLLIR